MPENRNSIILHMGLELYETCTLRDITRFLDAWILRHSYLGCVIMITPSSFIDIAIQWVSLTYVRHHTYVALNKSHDAAKNLSSPSSLYFKSVLFTIHKVKICI